MGQHTETYRGHQIKVEAIPERTHAWKWEYEIRIADQSTHGHSRRLLSDEATALRQGIGAARVKVDELVKQ